MRSTSGSAQHPHARVTANVLAEAVHIHLHMLSCEQVPAPHLWQMQAHFHIQKPVSWFDPHLRGAAAGVQSETVAGNGAVQVIGCC